MRQFTKRLKPKEDLKAGIIALVNENNIKAGVLVSIVAGLENAKLRMPGSEKNAQIFKDFEGPFEVVAGTGTVSVNGCHIHISLSDKNGNVIGGHLMEGCLVKYTAEIVVLSFDDAEYKRVLDKNTGFDELEV